MTTLNLSEKKQPSCCLMSYIHLNKDTVNRDANFTEHVDFLGTETVKLTHPIGIATFKGDIVGAPTKPSFSDKVV